MKFVSNVLIYVSIIYILVYFYNSGKYEGFDVNNIFLFILSIILIFFGHIVYVLAWKSLIKKYNINKIILFESESITIFNKYIPGKIWVVVGPVAYLKKFYNIPLKEVSQYSLYLQVIIIWTGLLLGLLFIYLLPTSYILIYIMLFLVLSLYLFSNKIHKLMEKAILLITKKSFNFVVLEFKHVFSIITLSVLMWLVWSLAFYLFFLSMSVNDNLDINILLSFIFPIAGVIGIIAILAPGGLGVREGIIISLLISIGFSTEEATQISLDSRIWFLIGEAIIFLTAVVSILSRKCLREKVC